MSANIPQYELLADHFFEPEVVGKGSIIEYDGVPNNLMKPLNKEAEAKLEEWYNEIFPLLDEKTGKHVVDHKGEKQYHQPRLELKPREASAAGKAPGIRVVAHPKPADLAADKTLAAIAHAPAKEWQRPEPEHKPSAADGPTGVKVVTQQPALAGNTTKGPA
jgi:hypothetical protein